MPQRSAVAASMFSAVSSSHEVRPQPIRRGSRAASTTDGTPTLTSGMPKKALSAAMRMSQAAATSSPAPSV